MKKEKEEKKRGWQQKYNLQELIIYTQYNYIYICKINNNNNKKK